jgi:hypothetical protein
MTVLIYVDTSKQVGDPDHLKVFANADAADTWLEENEPEGVAFEYEVLECKKARRLPLLTSGAYSDGPSVLLAGAVSTDDEEPPP